MKVTSNIFRYFAISLSFCALSALQAAQISDKERYLLSQASTYDDAKDDEKVDNQNNGNNQNELDKAFLEAAKKGDVISLKKLKDKGANLNSIDRYGDNALHLAALYAPEGKGIKWLIHTAKIAIESQGEYEKTPFLCAAQNGNLDALIILKSNGAKVDSTSKNGDNALHWAIWNNVDIECIKWLINIARIDIESQGYKQKTPFLYAAEKGNLDALQILKNNGAHVKAKSQYGNNALHCASLYAPDGKGIEWLIHTAKIDIESKNNNQYTPFLCAAEKGNLNALIILKNNGAHVKAKNQYSNNALHLAALYAPDGKGIEWLIHTAKVDIESKNNNQATPFLCAAEKDNLDALIILKNNGANLNAIDKNGENVLHSAIWNNVDIECIKWLINIAKIDIESQGYKQKTPFLYAAKEGNVSTLRILKNNGANVKITDKNQDNALHWAIWNNVDIECIKWLIYTAKIDIESRGYKQKTPFLYAAAKGNIPVLRILKNSGAKVKAKNQYGNNALHLAALYAPDGKGIEWLIHTAKIDIESKGKHQMAPFLMAAEKGNLAALRILKNNGANVDTADKYGNNALHWAIWNNVDIECIKWLIYTAKINIESQDYKQKKPFLMAAEKSNLPALKILKNSGAKVKTKNQYGNNALHWAIWNNVDIECIKWLINIAKIDVESQGYKQKTPFLYAAEKGNLPALKILKNNGANVKIKNQYGNNALHLTVLYALNGKGIEWLILIAKIDIESKGYYQKTAFLMAAQKGNLDALKILKNNGANLNATDKNGDNALHYAALYAPNGKGIEWLILTAKIDIESKGYYQKTAFLMAAQKGNLDALKILKNKRANVNATDKNGNNALVYAKKLSNSQETIDWLQEVCGLTDE